MTERDDTVGLDKVREKFPDAELKEANGAYFLSVPNALTEEDAAMLREQFSGLWSKGNPRLMVLGDGITIETADFEEWLAIGVGHGWVSERVCATHEGVPSTSTERDEWDEGGDPCEVVLRVWVGTDHDEDESDG